MTVLASDDFAGTGALSGSWTVSTGGSGPTPARVSDELDESASSFQGAVHSTSPPAGDYYVKIAIGAVPESATDNGFGPMLHWSGSGWNDSTDTGYFLQAGGDVRLYRKDTGSGNYVQLGTTLAVAATTGDVYEIQRVGSTIVAKKNGSNICGSPITDTNYTTGSAGFMAATSGHATADNWEMGSFSASLAAASGAYNLTGATATLTYTPVGADFTLAADAGSFSLAGAIANLIARQVPHVTELGTRSFNTTSGTHTVTATPAVGDLIILICASTGNTSATAPTDNNSDGNGTYTLINTAVKATSADTMKAWVRNSLIGSATSTVFTHAPGTSSGGGVVVLKVTNMTKTGAAAIRQSQIQSNQASGTPAPAFGSAALARNPVIGAVFNATNAAGMTPRANFTELLDVGYATPTTGLEVMARDNGETGTTQTWGGSSASAYCSIIFELNTAAYLLGGDGLYLLTPPPAALTYGAAAGSHTLTAAAGSFALTGATAALRAARKLAAAAASFVITGTAATLSSTAATYRLTAEYGTLIIDGATIAFRVGKALTAAAGSYAITGTAARLAAARKLAASAGAYALTGTANAFRRGYSMAAAAGAYAISGTTAALRAARRLVAAAGAYAQTGTDVTLSHGGAGGHTLAADAAAFVVTGAAVALKASRRLVASSATFAITGAAVTFARVKVMAAASGSFAITGAAAAFKAARALVAQAALYLLTGADANLTFGQTRFYYLAEAIRQMAANIIAAIGNTNVTIDYGGPGATAGVRAIRQARSYDPRVGARSMNSQQTEFLIEKLTAPASLKPGVILFDETNSEQFRVFSVTYQRGGIATIAVKLI